MADGAAEIDTFDDFLDGLLDLDDGSFESFFRRMLLLFLKIVGLLLGDTNDIMLGVE